MRTGLAAAWFAQGIYMTAPVLRSPEVYRAAAVFAASLLILILLMPLPRVASSLARFALPGLCLLLLGVSSLDAVRVLSDMVYLETQSTWLVPGFSGLYASNGWAMQKDGRLLTYSIPDNLPASRPARIEKVESWQYSWEGFFTGAYTFRTALTPNQLRGNVRVSQLPEFKKYMLREWLPLYFPERPGAGGRRGGDHPAGYHPRRAGCPR